MENDNDNLPLQCNNMNDYGNLVIIITILKVKIENDNDYLPTQCNNMSDCDNLIIIIFLPYVMIMMKMTMIISPRVIRRTRMLNIN